MQGRQRPGAAQEGLGGPRKGLDASIHLSAPQADVTPWFLRLVDEAHFLRSVHYLH